MWYSSHEDEKLAQKLASDGPNKCEATPRRVRGLLNGKYVFDTTKAYHVWEHPYYPRFYVPVSSFTSDSKLEKQNPIKDTDESVYWGELSVGNRGVRVLIFYTPKLKDLVRVPSEGLDQWFEEDVPIYSSHPKDPYKRIDILPSSRSVKVSLDGVTLAEASNPLFLLETTLRTRYYLPPTTVNWEYLSPSKTETYCPYKGKANYYHVTINGKTYEDLIWYYRYPTLESSQIVNHLCFYNEKVDLWVDGVKE